MHLVRAVRACKKDFDEWPAPGMGQKDLGTGDYPAWIGVSRGHWGARVSRDEQTEPTFPVLGAPRSAGGDAALVEERG